ncbi:MAG TPA: hypothetical protein VFE05_16760 [Longimicrobiaceae bacterium]|jgi:hypothetical protein|nr:hypothetical protein [Longimicrobiaceae bacterium]
MTNHHSSARAVLSVHFRGLAVLAAAAVLAACGSSPTAPAVPERGAPAVHDNGILGSGTIVTPPPSNTTPPPPLP